MSELNELIKKLCPDGVEYKKLGEVCILSAGGDAPKTHMSKIKSDEYKYPIYSNGVGDNALYGYTDEYKISNPCVTVAARGTIGWAALRTEPFYPIVRLICLLSNNYNELNVSFLKYVIDIMKFPIPEGGIPQLTIPMLKNREIPVPPLPVQSEVVRILDSFTELEAELEAELAGRIEQYEYFRYYLLDEKNLERIDGKPAETKKLGEIVDILDSKRKPVKRGSRVSGKYPYYGANGVQDYINDYLFDGEFLLVGEDGSVITDKGTPILNWANGKIWVNNHTHVLQEKADKQYMLRYIKYALECKNIAKLIHDAIPKLNQQTLKSIEIPVPFLDTQKRIVDILDRFDTLTTSLTDGIPAEIAMRREQYEYYRSRLLDFPRLPDDAVSNGE